MKRFLSAIALAGSVAFSAPAHAQHDMSVSYYDATAGGCSARFMHRVNRDLLGGQAAQNYTYSTWVKVADTCGGGYNDTSNFAAFGFCTVGTFYDASPCSVHGLVYRRWTVHANCGRELLAQIDGAAHDLDPQSACIGYPIY